MLPFAGTIFISAFLLFQVQPLISRVILPWYGGTPAVWTTCMLFFQAVLLAGYCYAHLLQSLPARRQALVHGVLLVIGVIMCKIMPNPTWKPTSVDSPIPSILMLLAANVGIPYLIASTTGPLLQAWFARQYPGTSPYRLYALSNVGSLLALVTYPAYFERFWTLHWQTTSWSIGFIVFCLFCGYCAWQVYRNSREETEEQQLERFWGNQSLEGSAAPSPIRPRVASEQPSIGDHFLWVLLACCGSTVFLATTNQMCEDIAVVPFLYILPLGLYLLSFILCFDSKWWYFRPLWGALLCLMAYWSVTVHEMGSNANIFSQVVVYSAFVFCACMVCHGELSRLKPAPEYLTAFFLLISCGGMLGGLFVGVVAPNQFTGYWEFPIVLVFVFLCFGMAMIRLSQNATFLHWVGFGAVCILGSWMFEAAKTFIEKSDDKDIIFKGRNFFGSLEVSRRGEKGAESEYYTLVHGRIEHGTQWRHENRRRWKTTYYSENSGIGLAIDHHQRNSSKPRNMRIAMVGLGTGTTAAYGGPGDYIRFYDINPMVEQIARKHFTFLKDAEDAGADVGVFLGDARIVMERQVQQGEAQNFDVIGLDAFSSDAIPAHLLTKECVEVYLKHLRNRDEGILAIHVSNRYLVLERICRSLAREFGLTPVKIEQRDDSASGANPSTWVLLTKNQTFLDDPAIVKAREMWTKNERALDQVWTDDYYNLFDVVDWNITKAEIDKFELWFAERFRDKTHTLKSWARIWMKEPNKWEKRLIDEDFDNSLEDERLANRRAREDHPSAQLDDVQEGFPEEKVKEALEDEKAAREELLKERKAEDEKRPKDREARHKALLLLKEKLDEATQKGIDPGELDD
jgi:hypothetical protein